MKKVITTLFITFLLGGCVISKVKDYSFQPIITSGETSGFTLKRIAIRVDSKSDIGVAQEAQKELLEQLLPYGVEIVLWNDMMPPVRKYELREKLQIMQANRLDGFLRIRVGEGVYEEEIIGFVDNRNTYGSGSVITPLKRFKRDTNSQATLFSSKDGSILWKANSETNAGGLLFMSDNSTLSSMVSEYISALEKRGFLVKPEKAVKAETALRSPDQIAPRRAKMRL